MGTLPVGRGGGGGEEEVGGSLRRRGGFLTAVYGRGLRRTGGGDQLPFRVSAL